ncbi:MAG: hypothetical protein AB1801_03780 [Chloroflexota bacterium]
MSTLKFMQQTIPQSGEELKQILKAALDKTSPLDDFIQIIKDLNQLEQHYQMTSEEFYPRFQRGELGDSLDFIRWANRYEIYQETKAELEQVFDLLEQYALPVAA